MDSSSTTITKTNFGKAERVSQRSVYQNSHWPFIFCLMGIYSCWWQRYAQKPAKPGQCCCGKEECVFFTMLLLTFTLWFTILYMWGEAKNDYHNFDGYAYGNLGFWFQWSTFLLFLAMFFFSYFLFLLIIAVCLLLENQKLYLHWSHKTVMFFFLILSILALSLITLLWRRQWNTFYLSFQITAPFLHMGAILAMIILAWPVSLHFYRMKNKVLRALILGPYMAVLLFLLFIPLGMYSPCIRENGTLGPKPNLIGHRGAPMVAPENTKMSFLKSIEYGAHGMEADVTISFDGIPFLMHDYTLTRTTDVESVFPEFMYEEAAMFPWPYLEKLNAGKWFFEKRPFFGMPLLSREDRKRAKEQKICKFSDFLKLAEQNNKYIIFDLYRPPKYHPYRNTYIRKILDVILTETKIRQNLVLWLPSPSRNYVHSVAPGFQQTSSSEDSIEELQEKEIVKLNLDYRTLASIDIRKYEESNITINLWVVSEPWLFSLVWCYGVHSVTTNAIHTLGSVHQPYFLMTPQEYRSMWIIIDTVAVLFISLIFVFFRWKEQSNYSCLGKSNMALESGLFNPFKRESDTMTTVA